MNLKSVFKSQRGLSLLEVVMAAGLLGVVSLGVMRLNGNMANVTISGSAAVDYSGIVSELDVLLADSASCSASLRGLTFQGSLIASTPIEVEMHYGSQNMTKTRLLMKSGLKRGKVKITNVSFSMPDYVSAVDFPEATGQLFKAVITVDGEKLISTKKSRAFPTFSKTIKAQFDTDSAGISTISNCVILASSAGGSGGSSSTAPWEPIVNGETAISGHRYAVNTSSAAVKVMLPPNPIVGDEIYFVDEAGSFGSNYLILEPGTEQVNGASGEIDVDITNYSFGLYYSGPTHGWRII